MLREIAHGRDPRAGTHHRIAAIAQLFQHDDLDHPSENSEEWRLFKYVISMSPEDRERELEALSKPYLTIESNPLEWEATEYGKYPDVPGAGRPVGDADQGSHRASGANDPAEESPS